VTVLQAWGRETPPPYTATSFQRWRAAADGVPNRNTLARFFGSWREALEASGLPTDGSRSQEANARAAETGAAQRATDRTRRRGAVLQAVDMCRAALGRVPTASEFLRWRLTHAPDSPGQAQVYLLFRGGWAVVLEALPPSGLPVALQTEPGSPADGEPLQPPAQPPHIHTPAREDLARVPDVQAGSVDQVGHEGVAGHEVAAWQRE
jgi:hypothetical protein